MKHTSLPFKAFIVFAAIVTAGAPFHFSPAQGQGGTEDHDSRIEVNAVSTCNDCHSAGPQTQFAPGGNPFFGQPAKINPATYLGGGQDVGPLVPTPGYPHIVSRNLAPDRTGLPEGGRPFSEFLQILRTGMDLDHLHQTCSSTVATNCLPPFDRNLLQIMSWPTFKNMPDYD